MAPLWLQCIALLLGTLVTTAAAEPVAPASPSAQNLRETLVASAPSHDAGRVAVGIPVTHTYELTNRGTTPLTLTVKPSCGCTTTDYDKVIAPGATGKLTAVFDTTNVRGKTSKTIRVTTDDAEVAPLILTLAAEAIPILDVLPSDRPIVRGPIGAVAPVVLTVTTPDGEPFEILRIEDDPALTSKVEPLPAPSAGAAARVGYRVTLTPKPDLPIGTRQTTVTLVTTRPKAERYPLRPAVIVTGPLAAFPPRLDIRDGAAIPEVRVATSDAGKKTFHVTGATTSDPEFTAELRTVAEGRSYAVRVRYAGKAGRGAVHAVLKIKTDEPSQPLLLVPISGRF